MKTVKRTLDSEGMDSWSIGPNASVNETIRLVAEKEMDALIAAENGGLAGVISERDCARQVVLKGRSSETTSLEDRVKDIMITGVVFAPRNSRSINARRSVPGIDDGETNSSLAHRRGRTSIGCFSMGDLIKSIIEEQKQTIGQSQQYITG